MHVLKLKGSSTRMAALFLFLMVLLQFVPPVVLAQNLGSTPQTNKAVLRQTAAQPEGTFLNLVKTKLVPVLAAFFVLKAALDGAQVRSKSA